MSCPRLPPEISDHIVDLLHGDPKTLKNCCLISKSWVARARRQLFCDVDFNELDDLKAWKKAFPDPVNSPARYTRWLWIGHAQVISDTFAKESGWVQAFSNVVWLSLWNGCETWPASQLFNLVCSLPLLEDLDVGGDGIEGNDNSTDFQSSTSPPLTGSLELSLARGIMPVTHLLLQLPNGVRFQKFECTWNLLHDIRHTMELVEACSDTLEYIDIKCENLGQERLREGSIDFSNAIRLEEVAFHLEDLHNVWTALALKTLTSKHKNLQQISIYTPITFTRMVEETHRQWMDLDRILVQLWESNAIHIRVVYIITGRGDEGAREHVEKLLPEVTERGIVKLEHFNFG